MVVTNSPANPQVANFYQQGGFIFNTGSSEINSTISMTRFPDGTRPTKDNSLVKLNRHSDFKIDTTNITSNIHGQPDIGEIPKGIKNKNYPSILDSERHRILIRMYNVPDVASLEYMTQAVFGVQIGLDGAVGYSRDNPTKYVVNEDTVASIKCIRTNGQKVKKHITKNNFKFRLFRKLYRYKS